MAGAFVVARGDGSIPFSNNDKALGGSQTVERDGPRRRQFEIARGIVRDELECRLARRLGVSVHTVHRQTQRLYKKAEASGRVRLVARLITEHVSGNGL